MSSTLSLTSVVGDAQTTVTSLAGGVAGAASNAVGNYLVAKLNPAGSMSFGTVGLEFCGRALISAAAFTIVSDYMPNTSKNIFFSILFFACDRGLMNAGVALSTKVVGATQMTVMSLPTGPAKKSGEDCKCKN